MENKANTLFIENPEKECKWSFLSADMTIKKHLFQDEMLKINETKTQFAPTIIRWHEDGNITIPDVRPLPDQTDPC